MKDIGPLSEMSEIFSLKIDVKFGTALNLGEKLRHGSSITICWIIIR